MKTVHYLALLLIHFSLSSLQCSENETENAPANSTRFHCRINEGSGFSTYSTQGPVFNENVTNVLEMEADLIDNRYLFFHFINTPGPCDIYNATNNAVYRDSNLITYVAQSGTLVVTEYKVADKILKGTFDNCVFKSTTGDSVIIEDGVFNIDM